MSEPADFARGEELLPGLEPPRRGASPLELATRRTIAALEQLGKVGEGQAMLCQLMLDLASAIDAGSRSGRASAVAMAAAQLQAAYQLLVTPTDEGRGDGDAFDQLAADLRCAAGTCDHPEHRSLV